MHLKRGRLHCAAGGRLPFPWGQHGGAGRCELNATPGPISGGGDRRRGSGRVGLALVGQVRPRGQGGNSFRGGHGPGRGGRSVRRGCRRGTGLYHRPRPGLFHCLFVLERGGLVTIAFNQLGFAAEELVQGGVIGIKKPGYILAHAGQGVPGQQLSGEVNIVTSFHKAAPDCVVPQVYVILPAGSPGDVSVVGR